MQCNVLQWQAFHMYQYFYIDHASPSQITQRKSTAYATCYHQTQEGAAVPWYRPYNVCTPLCGWHEAIAPARCPSKHSRVSLTHKLIQTGASLLTNTCHASITGTTRLLVSISNFSSVQDFIQDREFLWCPLLEKSGTLYSSYCKGHRIVLFLTLRFSSLSFDPRNLWGGARAAVVWS